MPLLFACQCLSRLMRYCSLGRWTCLLVSECYRLVWRCRLFDSSTYIPSCVHWHGGRWVQRLIPDYVAGFGLSWSFYQKHYIIGVVGVGSCFAGYLLLLSFVNVKPFLFYFIDRCSLVQHLAGKIDFGWIHTGNSMFHFVLKKHDPTSVAKFLFTRIFISTNIYLSTDYFLERAFV